MATPTSFHSFSAELRVMILDLALTFDETVTMRNPAIPSPGITRSKRKADIKRGDQQTNPLNVLLASKKVYIVGLDRFWKVRTFAFLSISDVTSFLNECHEETSKNISQLALFRGFRFTVPTITSSRSKHNKGPPPDWPASLNVLSSLPKLRSLHLDTDCFHLCTRNDELLDLLYGEDSRNNEGHARNSCLPNLDDLKSLQELGPFYARDILIKSIPDSIFAQLQNLTISFSNDVVAEEPLPRVYLDTETYTVDILAYARDLRAGAWDVSPFGAASTARTPQAWAHHLWVEARAAAHWDNRTTPPEVENWGWRQETQWSTWAHEWEVWQGDRNGVADRPLYTAGPRSLDELFERDEGGELLVREAHSFERTVQRLEASGMGSFWARGYVGDQR